MIGINATITGYVWEVIEGNGPLVVNVRIPGRKDRDGNQGEATWIRVKCGRNVDLPQLRKGDEVEVQAWAQTEAWTDKQTSQKRTALCWWGKTVRLVEKDNRQRQGQRQDNRQPKGGGNRQPERDPDVPRAEPKGGAAAGGYDDADLPFSPAWMP